MIDIHNYYGSGGYQLPAGVYGFHVEQNPNLIMLGGGTRVSHIEMLQEEFVVYISDTERYSPAHSVAAKPVFDTDYLFRHPMFGYKLVNFCEKYNIKYVLPASHHSLYADIPEPLVMLTAGKKGECLNKRATLKGFMEAGVDYTKERYTGEAFVREIDGSGSHGSSIVKDASSIDNSTFIGTEVLNAPEWREFSVDVLSDKKSNPVYVVPRWRNRSNDRGEVTDTEIFVDSYVTIRDQIKRICKRFELRYFSNIQGFANLKSNEIKWFEINPRFGGGITASYMAGCKYPYYLKKILNGWEAPEKPLVHWNPCRVTRALRDFVYDN